MGVSLNVAVIQIVRSLILYYLLLSLGLSVLSHTAF